MVLTRLTRVGFAGNGSGFVSEAGSLKKEGQALPAFFSFFTNLMPEVNRYPVYTYAGASPRSLSTNLIG